MDPKETQERDQELALSADEDAAYFRRVYEGIEDMDIPKKDKIKIADKSFGWYLNTKNKKDTSGF